MAIMRVTVVLAIFTVVVQAHDFKICDGVTDTLGIKSVDLKPDEPVGGKNLVVTVTGGPNQDAITGGKALLKVRAYGVVITSADFSLCDQFGIKCPLAANSDWTGEITYMIPSIAPAGLTITGEVDIQDANGKELSCFSMDIKIGQKSLYERSVTELGRRFRGAKMFLANLLV